MVGRDGSLWCEIDEIRVRRMKQPTCRKGHRVQCDAIFSLGRFKATRRCFGVRPIAFVQVTNSCYDQDPFQTDHGIDGIAFVHIRKSVVSRGVEDEYADDDMVFEFDSEKSDIWIIGIVQDVVPGPSCLSQGSTTKTSRRRRWFPSLNCR